MKRKSLMLLISLGLIGLIVAGCASKKAPFKQDEKIIFFGDSITELGDQPGGYVTQVRDSLHQEYPNLNIQVIGAGISGHKVPDLQARLERDVLSKNPSIVVIYIGINDVWHWDLGIGGTPKDVYKSGLIDIISKIKANGARVILCTPSVIGEKKPGTNKMDSMLDEYSQISRNVADSLNIQMVDLREKFKEYELAHNPDNLEKGVLTKDGVHLSPTGHKFVTHLMLKALKQQKTR